jgi:hypothetical protein
MLFSDGGFPNSERMSFAVFTVGLSGTSRARALTFKEPDHRRYQHPPFIDAFSSLGLCFA